LYQEAILAAFLGSLALQQSDDGQEKHGTDNGILDRREHWHSLSDDIERDLDNALTDHS
jgi:hypothetical protein